jgi:hypothetical protein
MRAFWSLLWEGLASRPAKGRLCQQARGLPGKEHGPRQAPPERETAAAGGRQSLVWERLPLRGSRASRGRFCFAGGLREQQRKE